MPEQPLKPVVVHAIIDNAYDGVIRFLEDAQRIGSSSIICRSSQLQRVPQRSMR